MQAGQTVYFKNSSDVRLRKGEVVARNGENWIIRGCRTAGQFTRPVFTVSPANIVIDHVPKRQRPKTIEAGHGSGLSLPIAESIRRKEAGAERFGMSEADVLQARAILESRRRVLRHLAGSNGIAPTNEDFDYEELYSEYTVATLAALRSQISKAPVTDLEEFRAYLDGSTSDSRIMMTVARSARTAAVRYLRKRSQYHRYHVDIFDYERRLAA